MGTKVFILFVCGLVLKGHNVNSEKVSKSGLIDNISEESVSRLYRNFPVGVYASATPYGAYSFHVPSFIAPKNIPGKQDSIVVPSNNYLRDSYGNQFEAGPALSYRNTLPQQYVQLQNLPAHLSQPLVSPAIQLKQATPHFFSSGQYNVQSLQSVQPSTSNRFIQQPFAYGNLQSFAPNAVIFSQLSAQQQQSPSNKNIYSSALNGNKYNNLNAEQKYQRLQQAPLVTFVSNQKPNTNQQTAQSGQLQQLHPAKQTTITTLPNGKKIAVNLVTKPPVPLLDLNLLEPLTFANPLVPQVQHYLPRINQATYHKLPNANVGNNQPNHEEFEEQNNKSYNNDEKPKNGNKSSPKKKQKKTIQNHDTKDEKEVSQKPSISVKGTPNESPEFTYEINSPNYKETYTEKKVSYNKETESEPKTYNYEMKTDNKPVHYSYEKNTLKKPVHVSYETHVEKAPIKYNYEEQHQKEPIQYSYVKTSKEPSTHVHYENNNENPKHLIYTIKSHEQGLDDEQKPRHHPRENSGENTDESSDENGKKQENESPNINKNHGHHVHYIESPKTIHHNPEHRQVQYYHTTNQEDPNIVQYHNTPQSHSYSKNEAPVQHEQQYFQPIIPEYEEDIRILSPHKPHESIRVDPNQHIQKKPPQSPQNQPAYFDYTESLYSPAPIVKGQPKQTNDEEESGENTNEENDKILANMFNEQEKNEENFEKSYKDAAYGFAAYDAPRLDSEKEIYNPESYGAPRYYSEYNVEKSPFKQYEADGDDFPTLSRLNYKDQRDKMQEDYYLDYAVSKPTSLQDRFRKKEGYYTLYKKQKPGQDDDDDENKEAAKYKSYEYVAPGQKQKQYYAKHKLHPESYEFDYSSAPQQPRDASAHATRPFQRYKSKTQFVEPQFQYGFEPISIPQLLDSELAAMASNENPKSEKQSARKKIYKENLFIKKTSTKGAKRVS